MGLLSSPEQINSLSATTALQLHALIPVTKSTTSFAARQRNQCQELLFTQKSTLLSLTWKTSMGPAALGLTGGDSRDSNNHRHHFGKYRYKYRQTSVLLWRCHCWRRIVPRYCRSSARCFFDKPYNTGLESTAQMKV